MDKCKDNLDDDNKMEEYKFDPNDYCRLCDGHLRGIRHMVECRRKREDESKNELVIAMNNKDSGDVKNVKDTKVERYVNVSIPEEPDKVDDVESETETNQNHETLAEKVSKLENEGDEMSDIVKEVEKAEKLMALIRDLENRDLSDRDQIRTRKTDGESKSD